jgi:prophage regulatory protein
VVDRIFYDKAAAAEAVSLSVSTLEKLVRQGRFPPPRKVSDARVAWLRADLLAWAEGLPVSDLPPPPNTARRG